MRYGDVPLTASNSFHPSPQIQTASTDDKHPGAANAASTDDTSGDNDGPAPAATFETVYALVREHYVDRLPADRTMSYGAIRSMLAALNDPNASFLEPDENAIFENEARGHYAGIGASLAAQLVENSGFTGHKVVVVSTLPGSPAEKAGLRTGDVITNVDGRWILGSDPFMKVNKMIRDLQEANKNSDTDEVERETDLARRRAGSGLGLFKAQMLLRGDTTIAKTYHLPADTLRLTVQRPGVTAPMTVVVQPGETVVKAAEIRSAASGVSLLKLPAFTDTSAHEVQTALQAMASDAPKTLVLDLRGNAGGIGAGSSALHVAESIDGLLASNGKSDRSFAREQLSAGNRTMLTASVPEGGVPIASLNAPHLIVLVDGGTAGAAEALAAALGESGRGTLLGGHTFGAAQVQSVYPLPDGQAAFTLVTGRLTSPKRVDWAGTGLRPQNALAPNAGDDQILRAVAALMNRSEAHVASTVPGKK
jgi:carboxyl-terminal processing protease